jgi:hypothetical protein
MILKNIDSLIIELSGYHNLSQTGQTMVRLGRLLKKGNPVKKAITSDTSKNIAATGQKEFKIPGTERTVSGNTIIDTVASSAVGVPPKLVNDSVKVINNPHTTTEHIKDILKASAKEVISKKATKKAGAYIAKKGVKNIASQLYHSIF